MTTTDSVRREGLSVRSSVAVCPRSTAASRDGIEAIERGVDAVRAGRERRDPVSPLDVGHRVERRTAGDWLTIWTVAPGIAPPEDREPRR